MSFSIIIAGKEYIIYPWGDYPMNECVGKFACGRPPVGTSQHVQYLTKAGEWREWTKIEDWFDTVGDIVNLLMKHVTPTEAEISTYEKAKDIVADFEMKYHR